MMSADANRGATFAPPLNTDELAFYDAVAQNESAVTEMGTTVLADIARDLVHTLRRDVRLFQAEFFSISDDVPVLLLRVIRAEPEFTLFR